MIFQLTSLRSRNSSAVARKLLTHFRRCSLCFQSARGKEEEKVRKIEKERGVKPGEKSEKCRLATSISRKLGKTQSCVRVGESVT